MRVIITREESQDYGTFGNLIIENNTFKCVTLELPDYNNKPMVSCIPKGEYQCGFKISPKFGEVYQVLKVPDRTDILIHRGNLGGDTTKINPVNNKNYRSDILGCILLGGSRSTLYEQPAVIHSKSMVDLFIKELDKKEFTLIIK